VCFTVLSSSGIIRERRPASRFSATGRP
jgi:hypothetical protein